MSWLNFAIQGEPTPVIFNNRQIGTATVAINGRPIVVPVLFAFLLCGALGISLAITAYRLPLKAVHDLEEELVLYQERLEERVESRTRELQETTLKALTLADQANAANRAKSEFLANMSHELRTPLNHIIGFTELVVDEQFGPLNAKQQEFLVDALRSSRHLLDLINDILDLAKVEAGKMELSLSQVVLRPLLENSLMMVREKALKHRIAMSIDFGDAPTSFRADERKLKQVFYNLLSNAVKFTPDGGAVRLEVSQADESTPGGLGLKFSVSDTGIGLAHDDLERIFQPFVQAESSLSRRFEGSGLGLTLTKEIIELHGGRIWAESAGLGKGSRFQFFIPWLGETKA